MTSASSDAFIFVKYIRHLHSPMLKHSGARLFFSIEEDTDDTSSLSLPRPLISFTYAIRNIYKMLSSLNTSSGKPAPPALERKQAIESKRLEKHDPPPSSLVPKCHPLEPKVTEEVDSYFIQHWPFPNAKAIQKFRDAGFSRVTCCYYPEALDDRIHFACRLLTLLFLIDGMK